jgi:hypothetical protein
MSQEIRFFQKIGFLTLKGVVIFLWLCFNVRPLMMIEWCFANYFKSNFLEFTGNTAMPPIVTDVLLVPFIRYCVKGH